ATPGTPDAAAQPDAPATRPRRSRSASQGSASQQGADAPWHTAGEDQPLRRLRSGGTGAEPPVREGAGRGEAQPTEPPTAPAPAPDHDPTADNGGDQE
ncbi:NADH-quinone oxidoreductase subunit C, partial [Streptomyces sp. SID9124]|nr:NADH-quinone oxidoreductase subunit C [Streptomyces sp. SID9124]